MFKFDYESLLRICKGVFCVIGAVWVVWRGNTYADVPEYSLTPPVMCALMAMALFFTAVALVFKSEEISED